MQAGKQTAMVVTFVVTFRSVSPFPHVLLLFLLIILALFFPHQFPLSPLPFYCFHTPHPSPFPLPSPLLVIINFLLHHCIFFHSTLSTYSAYPSIYSSLPPPLSLPSLPPFLQYYIIVCWRTVQRTSFSRHFYRRIPWPQRCKQTRGMGRGDISARRHLGMLTEMQHLDNIYAIIYSCNHIFHKK